MPMCVFGCERLYENGYISVKNGSIEVIKESNTLTVQSYLDRIKRRPCSKFNNHTKKYFDWHYQSNKITQ